MRYFLLKDLMSPEGDLHRVHDNGDVEMDNGDGGWMPAFDGSAKQHGTSQFYQLQDYARKRGQLVEVDRP